MKKYIKNRIFGFVFLFSICFIFLISIVLFQKIKDGKAYEAIALTQPLKRDDKMIYADRGNIYDRNHYKLAGNSVIYNVILDPMVLYIHAEKKSEQYKDLVLQFLSETLQIPLEELNQLYDKGIENKSNYQVLAKGQTKEIADIIANKTVKIDKKEHQIKGIFIERESKRIYPFHDMASQTIGFIRDKAWGLEKKYNDVLTGIPGRRFVYYDDKQTVTDYKEEIAGNDIITTLDFKIQAMSDELCKKGFETFEAERTAILVSNPQTGEILAMSSYPGVDLNFPAKPNHMSETEWEELDDEKKLEILLRVWRNFNVCDTYELGSIFKPLVIAAALEENAISMQDKFYCPGYKIVADRKIKCNHIQGHGVQNYKEVLAHSCNPGMIEIIQKLGKEKFYAYQKDFGFGYKTDIGLPAEESAETLLHSFQNLGPVELATSSMGQRFTATSIQMLSAFNSIINGGKYYQPYIISAIVDQDNNIVQNFKPIVSKKIISEKVSEEMRYNLEKVILEGTGKRAFIENYRLGGKTGTAEVGLSEDTTLSFIGFLTVDQAIVSALVVIDKPKVNAQGSTAAAPIFRELMKGIIDYYQIPPLINGVKLTKQEEQQLVKIEDYSGKNLLELVEHFKKMNLSIEISGKGSRIKSQTIVPGTEVPAGSTIIFYMESADEHDADLVKVPNVLGQAFDVALAILKDHGLQAAFEGDDDGIVVEQKPIAQTIVQKNEIVYINIKK